ncbi:hypothetical protein Q9966_016668, partial [Columba livia]
MAAALERWVSGQLQALLGLSGRHVPAFLVALARRSRSPDELLERLRETEALRVEEPGVRQFARELWDKVPRATPSEPPGRAAERAALELRNRQYQLVESDDEGAEPTAGPTPNMAAKRRRHLRARRPESPEPPETPETPGTSTAPAPAEDPEDPDSDGDASERERLRDLAERDAFAERLRQRDRDRTRHPGHPQNKIPELRKRSRREYLAKREQDKLEELEAEIQDEEQLFGEAALSLRERRELQRKRLLRDLARQYQQAGERERLEKSQRYRMPEETRDK